MDRLLPPATKPHRQVSSNLLTLCGLILIGIGVFFAIARPALLPEDARYIGITSPQIHAAVPGLARWLDKVFWVMGGYIVATGLLVCYLARTSFRAREWSAWGAAALVGATSVGVMTAVNFVLASDFRWPLLAFAMLWTTSLVLFVRGC